MTHQDIKNDGPSTGESEWFLFQYGDENGKIIRETWAQVPIQGVETLDRETALSIGETLAPKIFCEIVKRQKDHPWEGFCKCENPGPHFHSGSGGKFCTVCGKDIKPK